MELNVSPYVFIMDVLLLIALGYAALYALSRMSRYGEPLNRFIVITAVSLLLATFGRILDVIDDVYQVPGYVYSAEEFLYFLSIVGVLYGLLNYIMATERKLIHPPASGSNGNSVRPGGYVFTGDWKELLDFLSSVSFPVLVFTRNPQRYRDLEHVETAWITQASDEGISPTRLHVLLDMAVNFLRDGGRLIVVDCVEVLVIYNDFPSVFRFLTTLKDYVVSADASLLLHLDENSLEARQLRLLLREFEKIGDLEKLLKTSS